MNKQDSYDVINCRIIRNGKPEVGKTVKVRDGKITAVADGAGAGGGEVSVHDAEGNWLVPGFVELHVHGCGDLSLEQEHPDGKMLRRMCTALSKYGVNTFLPTLQANEGAIVRLGKELTGKGGGDVRELRKRIPGLYVEGPFVHPEKRGGILEEHIEVPKAGRVRQLQDESRGTIKMMTIAPELPGADEIVREMEEEKIIPCFGHSAASAFEAGARAEKILRDTGRRVHITHLFNAMSPLSHREPGLSMLPFLYDGITFEVNGDGVHIHPDMLRLCWRHLRHDRMVLISDAVVSAGNPPGEYTYFGREVVSGDRGVRYKASDVLIGSRLLVSGIAAVFADVVGAGVAELVPLITDNPRRVLSGGGGGYGGYENTGITVGAEADLVLIDDTFELIHNYNALR